MYTTPLLSVLFAFILPKLSLAQDDPALAESASLPGEGACYAKSLATGSGVAAAIKGFCGQIENTDSDSDNPTAAADLALNGYTAGGFDPSGVMTTARVAYSKDCTTSLGDEDDCLAAFWPVCEKGDKFGRGSIEKGCLDFKIE